MAFAFAGDVSAALMKTANTTGHSRLGTPRTVLSWGNDREHSAVAARSLPTEFASTVPAITPWRKAWSSIDAGGSLMLRPV